jgi:hypothetical protein
LPQDVPRTVPGIIQDDGALVVPGWIQGGPRTAPGLISPGPQMAQGWPQDGTEEDVPRVAKGKQRWTQDVGWVGLRLLLLLL